MIETRSAPERLVDADGRLLGFGVFDGAVKRANLEQLRLRWRSLRLPDLALRLRLKEWQHFALVLPEAYVGLAVVDAGYLRTTWCYVVERPGGRAFEHKRTGVALDLRVARDLWRDRTHARARGYRVEIENLEERGLHELRVEIEGRGGLPAVRAELRCGSALAARPPEPLVVVMPAGDAEHPVYTHKVALPLAGELAIGERTIAADPASAVAILDVHKALYPRHTFWHWATFAGRERLGRSVALNLTRNVNRDDARVNENCLWLDGRIAHLGPAELAFDRDNVFVPWRVCTLGGEVELRFTPRGERSENLRLGLVRSVFHQLHGSFDGRVRFGGEEIAIEDQFGLCEDHDSVW
jgi:hypothetical protein